MNIFHKKHNIIYLILDIVASGDYDHFFQANNHHQENLIDFSNRIIENFCIDNPNEELCYREFCIDNPNEELCQSKNK